MTTQEFLHGRRSMREEAAKFIETTAGQQPCDCIETDDKGFRLSRCYCQNYGDNAQAASWCTDMNTAVAVRSIQEYVEIHDSDCSMHNMPAYPNEPCDCSVSNGDR